MRAKLKSDAWICPVCATSPSLDGSVGAVVLMVLLHHAHNPPSFAACSHSMPARRGSKRGRQYLLDAKQEPTHALASRQKRTRSTQSHGSSSSSITTGSTSICSAASSGGGAGGSAGAGSIASGGIEFSVVLADATTLHEATWWFAHYHRMLRRRRGSLRAYRGQDAVRNSTCIVLYMHCAARDSHCARIGPTSKKTCASFAKMVQCAHHRTTHMTAVLIILFCCTTTLRWLLGAV